MRTVALLCALAGMLCADGPLRILPGTNIFVMLPEELSAYGTAQSRPYVAFKGMIYDVGRIWGTLNADGRYNPASDVTAIAGSKDADAIRKEPIVGQMALRAFSVAELAACNGRNGPKYIAYERIVYDFSKVKWGSRYHPLSALGRDNASIFMRTCGECHGPDVFPQFPVVGVVTNAK